MDSRTMAFINLNAVLGGLARLCQLCSSAADIIKGKDISVGISVKAGRAHWRLARPSAT